MGVDVARGLKLITPLHLAANVDVAVPIRRRVYGCAWENKLDVLAELFQKMGYLKGMIVHGLDGIDEVSTIGKTRIVEFTSKKAKTYTITPGDMGIKKAEYKDIKAISKKRNVVDFLRILYGKEKGPRRDIVLANASVSLYVLGKAKNLALGVKIARESIDKGLASNKLEQLVETVGNKDRFIKWKKDAGLISN
jgi:anthranilate phosphoribosyltransferase